MLKRLFVFVIMAVILAGCATPVPTVAPTIAAPTAISTEMVMATDMPMPASSVTAKRTQYPVTIKDCGDRSTTYDKAPQRVVTIDPNIAEMMLLLGLKDRIVGYTEFYTPDQQWAPTKADMQTLKQINDINVGYPSKEAIVALNPDLVASIYTYAFMDPLPDRDGWTKLGVKSYEAVGECYTKPPTDFSLLYQDLRNFGIIFDVQDRAEAEIAKLQARVAALQQKAKDAGLASKKIGIYDGTPNTPTIYGGTVNAVITLAGATYIWADVDPNGTMPGWEQFVAANPDVIWVVPDAGPSVDTLEQQMANDPRLNKMPAVMNKAYIVVPQADATVESPRLIDGLEKMINGLMGLNGISMHTQYPVTVADCGGRETTYSKAPERVVTLDPAVTESLLVLGLKDKIVGFTEFQTPDQRWTVTKADMDSLNVINKDMMYPSKEAIVAVTPDLVMSVYPSALLSNPDLPDRDGWKKLGVNTYLTQGECHLSTKPVTDFSALYTDLHNFGVIFDVQQRAEAEIVKLQARVAALQKKVKDSGIKPMTVWSYSGEKDPYPAGSVGTPNAIITLAGATNAFGDVLKDYDAISWEEIVKRNPDVIWVMTSAGEGMFINELKGIEDELAVDPRLVNIAAVKNKSYVVVSYNVGGIETPRNVDGLEEMINGLLALK